MENLFEQSDVLNSPVEAMVFDASKEVFPIDKHWHYFMEIIYLHSGSVRYTCSEQSGRLEVGELAVFPPKAVHSICSADGGNPVYSLLKFDINRLRIASDYSPRFSEVFRRAESSEKASSILTQEHPEFFYRKPDGSMGNRVGDWTDVVDLDYGCRELWDYQIQSLVMWAQIVDGFRCDVASFVPVEFWCEAREAVERVRPGAIWLAETVHSGFGQFSRMNGMYSANDYEMFRAFDMEYDYDVREVFDKYLKGEIRLSHYIDMLNFQECLYPMNHIKMRCLENHDQPRICHFVKDEKALVNYTAMLYFLKGTTLIYAGQEYCCDHVPSLFEKDVFSRGTGKDISSLLRRLYEVKRSALSCEDGFRGSADDEQDVAILERDDGKSRKLGVFSLRGVPAEVKVELPDGEYRNLLDDSVVKVSGGVLNCTGDPILLAGLVR